MMQEAKVAARVTFPSPIAELACKADGHLVMRACSFEVPRIMVQAAKIAKQAAFHSAIPQRSRQRQRPFIEGLCLFPARLMIAMQAERVQGMHLQVAIAEPRRQFVRLTQTATRRIQFAY